VPRNQSDPPPLQHDGKNIVETFKTNSSNVLSSLSAPGILNFKSGMLHAGENMSVMNANMNIQIDKAEMPDIYKVSEAEIRPLAEELYLGTNCEPAHDADNWKCAQYILEQKRRVQIEIEKAARQGHF
jgi:hypothetical protein